MTRKPRSDNAFERGMPGTDARTLAEEAIEELRQRGGVFVDAVRATRMPMVLTDPNLAGNPIVFANQSFLNLSGYSMEEVLGQHPYFMNGEDTNSRDAGLFRDILDSGQDGIVETVQYAKNGRRFVATVLLSAFKDDDGNTLHHFLSWADVTRRVEAEDDAAELRKIQAALRESELRLTAAFESVPVGLAVIDAEGKVILANAEYRKFVPSGVIPSRDPACSDHWRAWDERGEPISPDDWPGARALRGEKVPGLEMLFAGGDGREIWTNVATAPTFDSAGRVTGGVSVISNIDERKRGAQALQAEKQRQELLLSELQHRVRNTLAIIRSIVRRTAASSDSVESFEQHLDGRLGSFARTLAYVTRDPEGGIDLELMIREELLAHAANGSQRVSIKGPGVRLSAKQAEIFGLAIHELTTNAIKHGALRSDGNKLEVGWSVEGNGDKRRLMFSWTETLDDRKLSTPTWSGFGTELLDRIMRYELDAEPQIEFRPEGFAYKVVVPIPQ